MATEIKTWQIVNGTLQQVETTLQSEKRTEPYDFEPWILSNPAILGTDIAIIGNQVTSKAGKIDILGIDSSGNIVIVELKRGELYRDVFAQAVDYASDVSKWTVDKLSEVCLEKSDKTLDELFSDCFPNIELENININSTQRIIIVGFSIESSLERMIEWMSDEFGVNINAIILKYIKTNSGDEILAKTSIISEQLEKERVHKQKKFIIPMSDEPGQHDDEELKTLLSRYLRKNAITNKRIRDILLPALLKKKKVTREELKEELIKHEPNCKPEKVGFYITPISGQLGMEKNDFLRQVIAYEYPNNDWEKDNFSIIDEKRQLIEEILIELEQNN
ncbi:hypothetical protein KAH81_05280 [bacterium]|nr:hypothetical protein [bacterium]